MKLRSENSPSEFHVPLDARRLGIRFLLYSHDGMGLGHTARSVAVATGIVQTAPHASVLLAGGNEEAVCFGLSPNVDVLKLPSLQKVANHRYNARRLNISSAGIFTLRSALLKAAVQSFRPHVMLVDKHPLGANGELRPALEEMRAQGGRLVLGLRDILDDRRTVREEWSRYSLHSQIKRYYDRVLIYGCQAVFDPIQEYDFPRSVALMSRFCGYVVNGSRNDCASIELSRSLPEPVPNRPRVMATVGGGEDGFELLKTFIEAGRSAQWEGIIVTGPMNPKIQHEVLQDLARKAGMAFYTFVPGLAQWLEKVDALVCMGGYNTLAEAVSRGIPTVCIPRTVPRREQLIRALAFEQLGLLRTLKPNELHAKKLAEEVNAVLRLSRQELLKRKATIDFDGARQAARHLVALANTHSTTPALLEMSTL